MESYDPDIEDKRESSESLECNIIFLTLLLLENLKIKSISKVYYKLSGKLWWYLP